jgi:hypothetical protein
MNAINPIRAISMRSQTMEVDEMVIILPNIPVNPQMKITA